MHTHTLPKTFLISTVILCILYAISFIYLMSFHLTPSQIIENLTIVSVDWANHQDNFAFE